MIVLKKNYKVKTSMKKHKMKINDKEAIVNKFKVFLNTRNKIVHLNYNN